MLQTMKINGQRHGYSLPFVTYVSNSSLLLSKDNTIESSLILFLQSLICQNLSLGFLVIQLGSTRPIHRLVIRDCNMLQLKYECLLQIDGKFVEIAGCGKKITFATAHPSPCSFSFIFLFASCKHSPPPIWCHPRSPLH